MNIIYTRYSPRPKKKGAGESPMDSIKVQTERCKRYCQLQGIEDLEILCDKETSAAKIPLFERPAGRELETLCENGNVQNIIVMKLDRIFRNVIDGLTTIDYFERKKIALHIADQGGNSINCSTAVGRMFATQLLTFAEFEPRQIAERTSTALKSRIANGFITGANPPYGYKRDPDDPKRFVEDENAQRTIEAIIELADTGLGVHNIANRLRDQGHKNGLGKPITYKTVKNVLERA